MDIHIPANFYTLLESKKWSERKEGLEIVEKATSIPDIENGDYNELVKVLKKTIAKDSNVVVSTLAAKCLCQLAQGLRQDFAPYANSCLPVIYEKFKEKKPNVVSVLRDTADALFVATNIENIYEDVVLFLDNKNPQIKSEMCLFLARSFARFPSQVMNKKTLRPIINALIKTLSDMDATVRENSAVAIGTAMKVTGEKLMMTLIADVEPIKLPKIKEYCEKAVIEEPQVATNGICQKASNGQAPLQPSMQTNGVVNSTDDEEDEDERMYEMLDPIDISTQIPNSFFTLMESKKWSERKEALEIVEKATSVPKILNCDFSELVRVLKKTVSKDSNVVVATLAAKCIAQLAQGLRYNFSPYANGCLSVIFEKFKEKKPNVVSVLRDAADAVFVGTNIESILDDVNQFLENKNPQIKSEICLFLSRSFAKFPVQVMNKKTLRPIINSLIKTLSDMDATVRDNSALAIGTAMKVTGEKLMMSLIADVEPIKLPKIKEFCEKAEVKKITKSQLAKAPSTTALSTGSSELNNAPAPATKSSATMIRSRNTTVGPAKRPPPTKIGPRASLAPPSSTTGSGATVKRTATIIKRAAVNNTKRASTIMPPPIQTAPSNQISNTLAQNNLAPNHQSIPAPTTTLHNFQPPLVSTPAKPTIASATIVKPSKQDQLDLLIFKLISTKHEEVIESLNELDEILTKNERSLEARINQLIDLASLQLNKSIGHMKQQSLTGSENQQNQIEVVDKICELLTKLFMPHRRLVATASQQSVRFLIVQIFTLIQTHSTASNQQELGDYVKHLNNLASVIMDAFEPANMMCILTGILNDPSPNSIVEPIKKAIIRSMRSFS